MFFLSQHLTHIGVSLPWCHNSVPYELKHLSLHLVKQSKLWKEAAAFPKPSREKDTSDSAVVRGILAWTAACVALLQQQHGWDGWQVAPNMWAAFEKKKEKSYRAAVGAWGLLLLSAIALSLCTWSPSFPFFGQGGPVKIGDCTNSWMFG